MRFHSEIVCQTAVQTEDEQVCLFRAALLKCYLVLSSCQVLFRQAVS